MKRSLSRRRFLAAAAASASVSLGSTVQVQAEHPRKKPTAWTIGCFSRPWGKWSYDLALHDIKAAGYNVTGYLGNQPGETFISPEASREYVSALKKRIDASGLSMNMAWLKTNHNQPLGETIRSARRQVDHASTLGVKFLMTAGVNQPALYDHFYRVMAEASAYAASRKIQIALKPHGGCSASADELLRCLDRVAHDNFRIWYDAGNIIHYTGKDPVADVERVASFVTGFCAKDCAKKSGPVMIQFGEGKVDFQGVFAKLNDAGFSGPVMVECCAGATREEVTANARANREFLESVFTSL